MAKDTLHALDRDTERLLFAGAQVARTDSNLDDRRKKLAPFAAKAPAIGKVVDQVVKVQEASGKGVAAELLNLSALMAQVRGAQAAAAAPTGEFVPIPACEPVESPLSPVELGSLVNALSGTGKGRPRIILDAVARDSIRDLRLLPYCVRALSDSGVSFVVETELLPKLGSLVVPELRASLRVENGTAADARKVRVLATILKDEAHPLLVQAIEQGSPELRAAGLEELAKRNRNAAEPFALRLIAEDRAMNVRNVAADTLAFAEGDAAMEALFLAFTDDPQVLSNAGAALAKLRHPKATARALSLLSPELLALREPKLVKGATGTQKKENEKTEREHRRKVELLCELLDVLASRTDDPEVAPKVLSVFHEHKLKEINNAAARALLKSGYDKAFDELAPSVYDADWKTRSDFIQGVLDREPARAFDRLGRFVEPAALTGKNHVSFAQAILSHLVSRSGEGPEDDAAADETEVDVADKDETGEDAARARGFLGKDPRWTESAVRLLGHKDLTSTVLNVLSAAKSERALNAILEFTTTTSKAERSAEFALLRAISSYKDPRVPPVLVTMIARAQNRWARTRVLHALRDFDDAAIVPAFKVWASSKKKLEKGEREEVDELIEFLERDRLLAQSV